MRYSTQSCTLTILLLMVFLPGCGQDNQTAAKIQGTVPTDNLSSQERRERAGSNTNATKSAGYPAPGSAGSSGGNRRTK